MKKKIIIIMPAMEIGGAERSLLGLLDSFDYSLYEVYLFIYRHEGEFYKSIPKDVIILDKDIHYRTFDVPIKSLLKSKLFMFGIARIISKIAMKMHCIISKEERGIWMAMQYTSKYLQPLLPKIPGEYDLGIMFLGIPDTLINKVNAKKKIAWNHTDYDQLFPNRKRDIELYDKIDKIVSVSEECNKKVICRYPQYKDKAIVIENIIAKRLLEKLSKEEINDLILEQDEVSLLSIGRFSNAKNFDNVPTICKSIIGKGVKAKWFIVGYGGDEQLIKDRIKENGMEKNVVILGKKTNPYPYIKMCDFYIQPSRYEGKCVAVREAQILSKPVIITDYDTAPSQLEDGVDGFIVPMDNEKCAEAIADIIRDDDKKEEVISNVRLRDYTNEQEIRKIYNLL